MLCQRASVAQRPITAAPVLPLNTAKNFMVTEESPALLLWGRPGAAESQETNIQHSKYTFRDRHVPFSVQSYVSADTQSLFLQLTTGLVAAELGSWDPFTTTVNTGLLCCCSSSSLHPSVRRALPQFCAGDALNKHMRKCSECVNNAVQGQSVPWAPRMPGYGQISCSVFVLCAPVTVRCWLTIMKKTTTAFLVEVREVAWLLTEMDRFFTLWFVGRSIRGLVWAATNKDTQEREPPRAIQTVNKKWNDKGVEQRKISANIGLSQINLYRYHCCPIWPIWLFFFYRI